jgi:hypothetical protein
MVEMLILKLNRNLEIFAIESEKMELIYQQKTENGIILSLFNGFTEIWSQTIWPKISQNSDLKILFIVGQKAGFTDSRVVSIWLNSLVLFETEKQITLAKYLDFQEDVDAQNYLDQNLNQILAKTTWAKHLDAAIYTREPSIGKH